MNSTEKYFLSTTQHLSLGGSYNKISASIPNEPRRPLYVRVIAYSIPVGWFPINADNYTININFGSGVVTANLTTGNYNINTFCTQLKTKLDTLSANVFTVTNANGIITMSTTASFTWTVTAGDCSDVIGITSTIASTANAITCPLMFQAYPPAVHLQCNLVRSAAAVNGVVHRLLTIVPIDKNFNEMLTNQYTPSWSPVDSSTINNIEITLKSEDNTDIRMLANWSLTLEVAF
jgi:hypothetical protein